MWLKHNSRYEELTTFNQETLEKGGRVKIGGGLKIEADIRGPNKTIQIMPCWEAKPEGTENNVVPKVNTMGHRFEPVLAF